MKADVCAPDGTISWQKAARIRRVLLLLLIVTTTAIAGSFMARILPHQGRSGLEITLVIFFSLLFAWISIGFWTALLGFFILLRRYDRFAISRLSSSVSNVEAESTSPVEHSRTAILIPIYNEDVNRVMAGVKSTYLSLAATGQLAQFDFFILSDSTQPDIWLQEEVTWAQLCLEQSAFGHIFYRHRRPNIKRKSGNIADFCRRWGENYTYMIVFDADSVMAGMTLVRLVAMMADNPRIGILQTMPKSVGRHSLIARIQQFSGRVYGPMFAAGQHFWQIGDAQYWGHNAIIRIAPFMEHCGLSRLSGKPPLGGDILSHDFVEAALMRGAGWEVWLAYDQGGSWEEPPPTLIDELIRDRRWCQGNIQHMRLLLARRIRFIHRVLFLNGAMAYVSALLWLLFLSLSSALAISQSLWGPDYFPIAGGLFPDWPIWNLGWALILLTSTFFILLMPKILSVGLIVGKQHRAKDYGGAWRLFISFVAEVAASMLFAPLRMLAHSKFVFFTLLGKNIPWNPPPREDNNTGWGEAFRFHGWGMVLALVWGAMMFLINRPFFWWLLPVLGPLFFAVPISVFSSRVSLGRKAREIGLFLIPEEIAPPPELAMLTQEIDNKSILPKSISVKKNQDGFVQAVVHPYINGLHWTFRREKRSVANAITDSRRILVDKALSQGPFSLSQTEKMHLLSDPDCIADLHRLVWELPGGEIAAQWGL